MATANVLHTVSSVSSASSIVAIVCLYGTNARGTGWILEMRNGRMLGDGAVKAGRTFTESLWRALGALEVEALDHVGIVRVFDAGGARFADVDLGAAAPIYGSIVWTPDPNVSR